MHCIVKQPIHDSNAKVWAYEILYSNASVASGSAPGDAEAAATLQSLLMQCNTESFLEGKVAFVTFTENLLRRNVPKIFSPQTLVLQIDHDFLLLPDALQLVREYHDEGYRVALSGFEFNAMYLSVLDLVDYVKLSFQNADPAHEGAIDVLKGLGKEVIGYRIDSEAAFARAKRSGAKYFQGTYIASSLSAQTYSLDLIPGNFFRLIVAVTSDEPNLYEIDEIISRDVTLTYSLLKLVNSAFFALRTKVTSVRQALAILGIKQLKQWVYLLSFNPDSSRAPSEFIKTSLMRASFCEALCDCVGDMPISASEAYLMGLFSTLGSLLQMPMEQALEELQLPREILDALLNGAGRAGLLYQLVLGYESANWNKISGLSEQLGLSQNVISQKYLECMDAVNNIWKKIM